MCIKSFSLDPGGNCRIYGLAIVGLASKYSEYGKKKDLGFNTVGDI